ncbi:NUDIX hydrolase [Brackiella oedipodis]|uniref:NUDIX hydrolase n=1 Tax=Brackiella oedipodis TaxID=124225 RepID=UPI00048F8DB5|nr:DUF4743 domain-containing protein [Brackiella oedipodis]
MNVALLQKLRAKLLEKASQAPIEGSVALFLGSETVGVIHPHALQVLSQDPQVRRLPQGLQIDCQHLNGAQLNQRLAEIAQQLQAHGCIRAWRNELLNVYGADQHTVLAQMERGALRPLGMLTRSIHLNAWHTDGRIYLAKRATSKAIDPGLWDTLVGGILNAEDTLQQGLIRESFEEAGLHPRDLQPCQPIQKAALLRRPLPEGYQLEELYVSQCRLPDHVVLKNQDGEVSEFRTFSADEVLDLIEADQLTLEAAIVLTESLLQYHEHGLEAFTHS